MKLPLVYFSLIFAFGETISEKNVAFAIKAAFKKIYTKL
jgi:hypothetical protein